MKARELVAVILRLFAFYLFLQFLLLCPQVLAGMASMRSMSSVETVVPAQTAYLAGGLLAYLPFAALLFVKADRLSRPFVRDTGEAVTVSGKISGDVQTCAFRCLGLYALIIWMPVFVRVLCIAVSNGTLQTDQAPFSFLMQQIYKNGLYLIAPAIGVLIGSGLVFKAQCLMHFIQPASPEPEPEAEPDPGT
ncbi:MAG: hypothetical protein LBW77_07015 [Verrucomicrobiota bacterium]|jgi:hypothetical protein|nr:hypothetical protein [Verrucomicrobiota bacterium]